MTKYNVNEWQQESHELEQQLQQQLLNTQQRSQAHLATEQELRERHD